MMGGALSTGERIEIRGFGSFFCITVRRSGRNLKTVSRSLPGKHVLPPAKNRERVSSVILSKID